MQTYPSNPYPADPARFGDTGAYPPIAAQSPASPLSSPGMYGMSGPIPSISAPMQAIPPMQTMPPMQTAGPMVQPMPVPPPLDARRQALLAVLAYNPVMLAAYLLYLYGPSNSCVAGPFCSFGELPSFLQGMLLLFGAGLLWMVISVGIRKLLEATPWHSGFARGVRAITEYRLVRPLFGIYGAAIIVGLLVGLYTWRLTPAALIIGGVTATVCLRCALARPLAPAAPPMMVSVPPGVSPRPV